MTSFHLFFYFLVAMILLSNLGFYSVKFMHLPTSTEGLNRTLAVKLKPANAHSRKLSVDSSSSSSSSSSLGDCTKWDISISQSRYPTPGIPMYIVQIVNTCVSEGCAPSDIHLSCGWFASARIVNPRIFKRVAFDDCLVNGGLPLKNSQSIRFTYANSFMYPLSFKSAKFC